MTLLVPACIRSLALSTIVLWVSAAAADEPGVSASATVSVQAPPTAAQPPPAAAQPPSAEPAPAGQPLTSADKVGRFMFNLKIGPAILAYPTITSGVTLVQAALTTELGFAVTPDRKGYLLLPLGFQLSPSRYLISIPIGFQYDIALPVRGLYLTPRGSIGYSAAISESTICTGQNCTSSTYVSHQGVITPEIGIKYIIRGRFNLGFDPFSLPIYFSGPRTCNSTGTGTLCVNYSGGAVVFYRLLFYGGVNF